MFGSKPRPQTPPRARPWRSDSGAAASEEIATRKSLAEGRVTLAPRTEGWVVASLDAGGELQETPVLDREGRQVQVWDDAGLSRWMADQERRPAPGLLSRLLRRLRA